MATNPQQQTPRQNPVPGKPIQSLQPALPSAGLASAASVAVAPEAAFTSPAKGAVLLHVHTSGDIATHVVENSTIVRLRSQFGGGPGFEKWLMQKLRNLLVSA